MSHSHEGGPMHDHSHSHANGADHGHTHDIMDGPGSYMGRAPPIVEGRDWTERAFTIGIGGPVGSGKTALMLELCHALRNTHSIAAVTNDIFTQEDAEFLTRNKALPTERIHAIMTGSCPHAAIREDISLNSAALCQLQAQFNCDLLLIESGGDNLAANYSRELADFIIYVIDVAGGDKVPRKGGPGTTESDLLVINKCDLAEAVGADLDMMYEQAMGMREGGPVVMGVVKSKRGKDGKLIEAEEAKKGEYRDTVKRIVDLILSAWKTTGGYDLSVKRWKEGAPRNSGAELE